MLIIYPWKLVDLPWHKLEATKPTSESASPKPEMELEELILFHKIKKKK